MTGASPQVSTHSDRPEAGGGHVPTGIPTQFGGVAGLLAGPFVLLYRCWDAGGALLYVGRTERGHRRVFQHVEKDGSSAKSR